ncbi:mucin-2-like [Amphibalanus amphitrite]|uniref:mucin-2-like n=1 Tax=Amphibalanus amphitrite TaxID=1232801 RepID=UPI001C8FC215|nr:mucin-2-like [Amphibalanus amphitrite]
MARLTLTFLSLVFFTSVLADYCEDFESGTTGAFWTGNPLDESGSWDVLLASDLRQRVPDLPAEPSGSYLAYISPKNSSNSYIHGRLVTTAALPYPAGSSISLRYWIRSQYVSSAALDVRFVVGTAEQPTPFLDLSDQSGPTNDQWRTVTAQIPASSQPVKLSIFGGRGLDQLDQVAIDDITVHGPDGLDHPCGLVPVSTTTPQEPTTTTPEPTTTTLQTTTTTPKPTTTTPEPTTTTPEPTTTTPEPTTTTPEPTTTTPEPTTTTPEPTTTTPEPTTTTPEPTTTTPEPTTTTPEPTTTSEPTTAAPEPTTTTWEPTTTPKPTTTTPEPTTTTPEPTTTTPEATTTPAPPTTPAPTTPSPAPPTHDPAFGCVCSLGTHDHSSDHVFTLVELPPLPAFGCDHEAEHLCEEECHTSRDVLEAAGAWDAQLDGARLGDLACAAWGQDVTDGLVTAMYQHVCDLAEKHTVSFEPHLCCAGGVYVECRWGMARNRLARLRP